MPIVSEKRRLEKNVLKVLRIWRARGLYGTPRFSKWLRIWLILRNRRYFYDRNIGEKDEGSRELFWSYSEKEFKQVSRVTPETFMYILSKTQNHDIFRNQSRHHQKPIWIQLLVASSRFGLDGNGG